MYVHVLGVALVFLAATLLRSMFHLETHFGELPSKPPHEFLSEYFTEGLLLFTLYPAYVVVAAVLLGAYDVPNSMATHIVRGFGLLIRGIGTIPGLHWLKPPTAHFPVEPIWYKTFHVATDGFTQSRPEVMVRMKRGDIYYGLLASYPILPDSERSKDFVITGATYAPAGGQGEMHHLDQAEGGGTVLLNSADVDSIQVYYDPVEEVNQP